MNRRFVRKFVLGTLLVAACSGLLWSQQKSVPHRTQDRPLADRVASQERPQRNALLQPDKVLQVLQLKNGDMVADIGAGTGYFTRRFARAVAPDGKVYAVDIAADVLEYQKERAKQENLTNIVTVVSLPGDPTLPKNSIDVAFFCDVIHHLENRVAYFRTLMPDLKPHGHMAIIDYPPDSPHRPHPPDELVPKSQAISEAEQAGFKFVKEYSFLPDYYFVVFEKPQS